MDHQRRKDLNELLLRHCEALEAVADKYPEKSLEHEAIESGAVALHFAITCQPEAFEDYRRRFHAALTPEQIEKLKSMHIDPRAGNDRGQD